MSALQLDKHKTWTPQAKESGVALLAFGPGQRRDNTALRGQVPAFTDDKGNGYVINELTAAQWEMRGVRMEAEWTLRNRNQEADKQKGVDVERPAALSKAGWSSQSSQKLGCSSTSKRLWKQNSGKKRSGTGGGGRGRTNSSSERSGDGRLVAGEKNGIADGISRLRGSSVFGLRVPSSESHFSSVSLAVLFRTSCAPVFAESHCHNFRKK